VVVPLNAIIYYQQRSWLMVYIWHRILTNADKYLYFENKTEKQPFLYHQGNGISAMRIPSKELSPHKRFTF
jgi:hypothetical protein